MTVWLFWVNDSLEGVYLDETIALMDCDKWRCERPDISWERVGYGRHRWKGDQYARVEVEPREVRVA